MSQDKESQSVNTSLLSSVDSTSSSNTIKESICRDQFQPGFSEDADFKKYLSVAERQSMRSIFKLCNEDLGSLVDGIYRQGGQKFDEFHNKLQSCTEFIQNVQKCYFWTGIQQNCLEIDFFECFCTIHDWAAWWTLTFGQIGGNQGQSEYSKYDFEWKQQEAGPTEFGRGIMWYATMVYWVEKFPKLKTLWSSKILCLFTFWAWGL